MASVVEIDQDIKPSGLQAIGFNKDDVFSVTSNYDPLSDLSEKFEHLKAEELVQQPITDLYCNLGEQRNCNNAIQPKYDIIRQPDQCMFVGGISTVQSSTGANPDNNQIMNANITTGYTMYACQTASDTLLEGIRTSVQELLSNVPKIVINGHPEKSLMPVKNDNIDVRNHCNESVGTKIWFGSHGMYSGGKYTERHRSKSYYRPYCLISRRHYSCQPLSMRRRRFGVSQKGSSEPGVDELTQLLSKLGTNEDGQHKLFDANRKKKWQYSPPPKYYMIRYRPCERLAKIRERSRSLNDLSLQNLQISAGLQGKKTSLVETCEGTLPPSSSNPKENILFKLPSNNLTKSSASGSQICQMVSGIGKLSMLDH